MGRDAGFLAQNSAIAAGAEAAIIPEEETEIDQLADFIGRGIRKSRNRSIVIVSEKNGDAMHYAKRVQNEYSQYDVRVSILGHLQRGGTPSASDRILTRRMGVAAVRALMENQRNVMIGIYEDTIINLPICRAIQRFKEMSSDVLNALTILSLQPLQPIDQR